MTVPDRVGRWALGDLARNEQGDLLEVVGFILHPAVVFRAIISGKERVEVVGCLNELEGLTHYARQEKP